MVKFSQAVVWNGVAFTLLVIHYTRLVNEWWGWISLEVDTGWPHCALCKVELVMHPLLWVSSCLMGVEVWCKALSCISLLTFPIEFLKEPFWSTCLIRALAKILGNWIDFGYVIVVWPLGSCGDQKIKKIKIRQHVYWELWPIEKLHQVMWYALVDYGSLDMEETKYNIIILHLSLITVCQSFNSIDSSKRLLSAWKIMWLFGWTKVWGEVGSLTLCVAFFSKQFVVMKSQTMSRSYAHISIVNLIIKHVIQCPFWTTSITILHTNIGVYSRRVTT